MRRTLVLTIVGVALLLVVGYVKSQRTEVEALKQQITDLKTQQAKPVRNVVMPTAEQAYKLQDDCSRRGEQILRENIIGSALTHAQVSRYNATTNRCYVRLEVHAANLNEFGKYDYSTYLYDGQTRELLSYFLLRPDRTRSHLGFGCDITVDNGCEETKIAACMNGEDCKPE
jgi:hypothetical protein